MDPALITALLASGAAAVAGFVGYWSGVGNTERRHKAREAALLDDLDGAIEALSTLATHPAGRHLRLVTEGA